MISSQQNLDSLDAGGLDVFTSDLASFRERLILENHTLKRALTDPRLLSGVGNAYSDEILHAAQLSPIAQTNKLKPEEWQRLYDATRATLRLWIDRLGAEATHAFPEKVTAFREGMAVHGRYGEPCPRCGDKVLRILLCRQRNQLLRPLPDRRQSPRRSQSLAPFSAQTGLAPWTNFEALKRRWAPPPRFLTQSDFFYLPFSFD